MEKSGLKILMIAPLSAGLVHGGVRMQSLKTAEHLVNLSHSVTYYNPWDSYSLDNFDIIHLFLAGNETLNTALRLRESVHTFVVSPVFYTRRSPVAIRSTIRIENIAKQFVRGIFSDYSIKASVCKSADLVLPNTTAEAALVRDGFGIPEEKISVVPNGVDLYFADASPDLFLSKHGIKNFTLFVGDASARRKNVLPLLQEHTPDDEPLVIIGKFDRSVYSRQCRDIINSRENILSLGPLEHDDPMLASAYAAAEVFVLPSQFETPGIAALEAGLAGCKIAITDVGGTREYFGDDAEYINPESKGAMIKAVRAAHKRISTPDLFNRIKEKYTWQSVAEQTLNSYKILR